MSESVTDPKQKLTADEVREAPGLDDWRHLLTGIRARFRTGDFATGLALVDRIGAAAEEADHHPDISLTYPEVIVTLSSHDVGGITSRDLDLARTISGFAAEAGAARFLRKPFVESVFVAAVADLVAAQPSAALEEQCPST